MSNARPTQSLTIHSPSSAEFRRNYPHFGTALSHGNGVLVDLVWNSSALRRMEARTAEGRAALEAIMPQLKTVFRDHEAREDAIDEAGRFASWLRCAIGAMVCALMTANGYARTNQKRLLGNDERVIGRGTVYRRSN